MVSVPSVHARIQENTARNVQLLRTLTETDYAIPAYQQNKNYITSLRRQIAIKDKELKDASWKVKVEYKDHEKYRDSHMRRLAYRIGGKKDKFAEEASKEEREWLEAVQAELRVKKDLETLNSQLSNATETDVELRAVAHLRNRTQIELDMLYNSIFEGPTPDIPGEDVKEKEVRQAEGHFNIVQGLLSTEKQARDNLLDADRFLKRARMDIQDALSANTSDLWGGGTWAEVAENGALIRAQSHVSQVEMLVGQARRVQPAVQHIGGINIAQMNYWGNVVFDNVFSDLDLRDRMKSSQSQLAKAQQNMDAQVRMANERLGNVQSEVDVAKVILQHKREELQGVRAEAFERVARGVPLVSVAAGDPSSYQKDPPAYTA